MKNSFKSKKIIKIIKHNFNNLSKTRKCNIYKYIFSYYRENTNLLSFKMFISVLANNTNINHKDMGNILTDALLLIVSLRNASDSENTIKKSKNFIKRQKAMYAFFQKNISIIVQDKEIVKSFNEINILSNSGLSNTYAPKIKLRQANSLIPFIKEALFLKQIAMKFNCSRVQRETIFYLALALGVSFDYKFFAFEPKKYFGILRDESPLEIHNFYKKYLLKGLNTYESNTEHENFKEMLKIIKRNTLL